MKRIITLTALALASMGCSHQVTVSSKTDLFYPSVKTKTGGSMGDPAVSRKYSSLTARIDAWARGVDK